MHYTIEDIEKIKDLANAIRDKKLADLDLREDIRPFSDGDIRCVILAIEDSLSEELDVLRAFMKYIPEDHKKSILGIMKHRETDLSSDALKAWSEQAFAPRKP
jgi:hypothetical protein